MNQKPKNKIFTLSHPCVAVAKAQYLGDVISVDGKNAKNFEVRRAKAQGKIKQIMMILEELCFGQYGLFLVFYSRTKFG